MKNLPSDWDGIQQGLQSSVLQSTAWAKFQAELGRQCYFDWSNHWAWVGFERRSKGLRYLQLPYGPTIRSDAKGCFDLLLKHGIEAKFDFVRVEPVGLVDSEYLSLVGAEQISELDPQHTQVIDLTQTQDQLHANMSSGHRNSINGAKRRGITVTKSEKAEDIEDFLNMLHETAARAKVKFHDDNYYKNILKVMLPTGAATFYIAEAEGKNVAAAIFYNWNGTRYYAHAGAFQDLNRKLNASAPLVWQAMLDAKQSGYHTMDLWGVASADAGPKHKWTGISQFKRSFGGNTVSTIGTWDIPINQNKYKAYRLYRKLRGQA